MMLFIVIVSAALVVSMFVLQEQQHRELSLKVRVEKLNADRAFQARVDRSDM